MYKMLTSSTILSLCFRLGVVIFSEAFYFTVESAGIMLVTKQNIRHY
mgnify:CR=1